MLDLRLLELEEDTPLRRLVSAFGLDKKHLSDKCPATEAGLSLKEPEAIIVVRIRKHSNSLPENGSDSKGLWDGLTMI